MSEYIIIIGIIIYVIWSIYNFPLFELHREAKKREIEVSPSILSNECFSMFWRWGVSGSIFIFSWYLMVFIWFAPLYFFHEILSTFSGWWMILKMIVFIGWIFGTLAIWFGFMKIIGTRFEGFNHSLEQIKINIEKIKLQQR